MEDGGLVRANSCDDELVDAKNMCAAQLLSVDMTLEMTEDHSPRALSNARFGSNIGMSEDDDDVADTGIGEDNERIDSATSFSYERPLLLPPLTTTCGSLISWCVRGHWNGEICAEASSDAISE